MSRAVPSGRVAIADNAPPQPGWYATIWCFEPREGFFPEAARWDGEEWNSMLPYVFRSPEPFASEAEACEWARDNDPEW